MSTPDLADEIKVTVEVRDGDVKTVANEMTRPQHVAAELALAAARGREPPVDAALTRRIETEIAQE